jgi:hypothetical protein
MCEMQQSLRSNISGRNFTSFIRTTRPGLEFSARRLHSAYALCSTLPATMTQLHMVQRDVLDITVMVFQRVHKEERVDNETFVERLGDVWKMMVVTVYNLDDFDATNKVVHFDLSDVASLLPDCLDQFAQAMHRYIYELVVKRKRFGSERHSDRLKRAQGVQSFLHRIQVMCMITEVPDGNQPIPGVPRQPMVIPIM